ncbi:hypothetical protein ACLOJK_033091 [Asimina triloba]
MELAQQAGYADSVDSSPHSLTTDPWDEPPQSAFQLPPSAKIRLMCSYGGRIVPRPHDKSLCYLSGHTRIVSFDRATTTLSSLSASLSATLLLPLPFSLKYQLPNEDLDSLISIATDEDLDNMIEEYDRLCSSAPAIGVANKSARIRLFVFASKPDVVSAPSSIGSDAKSESWFVDALNGADVVAGVPRGMSADVNTLLGLDVSGEDGNGKGSGKDRPAVAAPDIQSVPGSPLVENASLSSFGSGSSMPSSASRFGADEGGARFPETAMGGLEEQFGRLGIGAGGGNRPDESFLPHSVFPQTPTGAMNSPSKDERVEQSSPMAKNMKSPPQTPMQAQQKQVVLDFLTDAAAGPAGAVSHTKPMFYQDSSAAVAVEDKISAATSAANPVLDARRDFSNPNYQIPVQVKDPALVSLQQHERQQQFFPAAGPHYIHHLPTGQTVPISSYYQMHLFQQNPPQQQQQLDQQFSMYYMPVGQAQPYNLALHSNLGDAHSIHSGKPAAPLPHPNPGVIPSASMYPARGGPPQRTSAAEASPQLIHVSDHQFQQHQQQQYMGYHQLQNQPQQLSQAAAAKFPFEFTDPSIAQMYYPQPTPAMGLQYQVMNPAAKAVPENSRPPQLVEVKQNRTSQPL